jgi:hypothetical protein
MLTIKNLDSIKNCTIDGMTIPTILSYDNKYVMNFYYDGVSYMCAIYRTDYTYSVAVMGSVGWDLINRKPLRFDNIKTPQSLVRHFIDVVHTNK